MRFEAFLKVGYGLLPFCLPNPDELANIRRNDRIYWTLFVDLKNQIFLQNPCQVKNDIRCISFAE